MDSEHNEPTSRKSMRMWSEKKRKSVALANAYCQLPEPYRRIGKRIHDCAPQILNIGYHGENPDALDLRTLFSGTCKARFCTICATLRARRQYARILPRFEYALLANPGVRAAFATFTIPNVAMDQLKSAGTGMIAGFRRMSQRKAFKRAVIGWMRAMELTLSRDTMMVHPHLHVVLLLRRGYFSRSEDLYLSQQEWLALWQSVMRDATIQIVDIRPLRPRKRTGTLASALGECTKYPLKPMPVWNERPDGTYEVQPDVLKSLHDGLRGKRLFAFGGILRGASQEIVDDESIDEEWAISDEDLAELVQEAQDPEPYFVEAFDWDGLHYSDGVTPLALDRLFDSAGRHEGSQHGQADQNHLHRNDRREAARRYQPPQRPPMGTR